MRRKSLVAFLIATLALLGAGCDDTGEGLEEDIEENTDQLEEEADEGLGGTEN